MVVVMTASEFTDEIVVAGELGDAVVEGSIEDVTDGALLLPAEDPQDATNMAAPIVTRLHRPTRMRQIAR